MKSLSLFFAVFILKSALFSQSEFRQEYSLVPSGSESQEIISDIRPIPLTGPSPFFSFTPVAPDVKDFLNSYGLDVRFGNHSGSFTDWIEIKASHDLGMGDVNKGPIPGFIGEMQLMDTAYKHYQYRLIIKQPAISRPLLRFDFFSPGKTPSNGSPHQARADTSCACPLPSFVDRAGWNCPDGNTASCSNPVFQPVSHLIVHHSAGSSTSNDWPAIVLAIWNLHVNTNGWCDIGYNWLIDRDGVVYEGRGGGDDVMGAHFCGTNSKTMGVCVLGNFQTNDPSAEAIEGLEELLAWKACQSDLAPLDTSYHASSARNLPVICGHRDGCSTACPGQFLYPKLASIRQAVSDQLDSCQVVTGILDLPEKHLSHLYPNPSQGNFILEFSAPIAGKGNWEIFNLNGQAISRGSHLVNAGQNHWKISLPALLGPGVYALRWQAGEMTGWKRIILQP